MTADAVQAAKVRFLLKVSGLTFMLRLDRTCLVSWSLLELQLTNILLFSPQILWPRKCHLSEVCVLSPKPKNIQLVMI